jgi:hypothetical protein
MNVRISNPFHNAVSMIWIVVLALSGCNESFDPRGDFDHKPVVYAVLSTDRALQFVRVEQSYMPVGYDPLSYASDGFVPNSKVTINSGMLAIQLRDTTVARIDTSRLRFPIRAYVASPFRPVYGSTYVITVEAPELGVVTSSLTMPARPVLSINLASFAVLDRPAEKDSSAEILFPFTLGDGTTGYIGRFFIEFEVLKDGEWVEERAEVATGFTYSGTRSYTWLDYGQLRHRPFTSKGAALYTNQFYSHALVDAAYKRHGSAKIIFDRIVFQLLQIDKNFYNYYLVTHSYSDPHSIRLDEPFYSNMDGGIGMVGAYTIDSVMHVLPEDFVFNRR